MNRQLDLIFQGSFILAHYFPAACFKKLRFLVVRHEWITVGCILFFQIMIISICCIEFYDLIISTVPQIEIRLRAIVDLMILICLFPSRTVCHIVNIITARCCIFDLCLYNCLSVRDRWRNGKCILFYQPSKVKASCLIRFGLIITVAFPVFPSICRLCCRASQNRIARIRYAKISHIRSTCYNHMLKIFYRACAEQIITTAHTAPNIKIVKLSSLCMTCNSTCMQGSSIGRQSGCCNCLQIQLPGDLLNLSTIALSGYHTDR